MPRIAYGGTPVLSGRKKSSKENAPMSAMEQPRKKARASTQEDFALSAGKENGSKDKSTEAELLQRVLALLQQPAAAAALQAAAPTSPGSATKEAAAAQAARTEAAFWKGQYEALQELRETAPEKRLRELRADVDSQVATMEKLAFGVNGRTPNDAAVAPTDSAEEEKAEVDTSTLETSSVNEEAAEEDNESIIEDLEAKLDEKRELVRAYQKLTGVVLALGDHQDDDDDDATTTVQCTAINHIHKRVVKFDLLLPPVGETNPANTAAADATFVPVANKNFLPENLRDSARFHSNQMPVLLQRLLKSLYAPPSATGDATTGADGSS